MAPSPLPLELIYHIVDHLSNDRSSLKNCCLSASAFVYACQKHLHHMLRLEAGKYASWDAVVEHFQQSPHLVKYVSRLDIEVDWPLDINQLSINPKFFLQFTNLETLLIMADTDPSWHSVPDAITVALSTLLVERSVRPLRHLRMCNLDDISPDLVILALNATNYLTLWLCIGSELIPEANPGKHTRAPVVRSPRKTVIVSYSGTLLQTLAWPQLRPYLSSIASFKVDGDEDLFDPLLALYVLLAPTIPEIHFPSVQDIFVEPEGAAALALALPSSWPALRTAYAYIKNRKELEEEPSWMLTQLLANVLVPHSTPNLIEIRIIFEVDMAGPQLEGPSFAPATPIVWQLNATTLAALDAACASHPTLVALHWTISIRTYLRHHRYADSDHALLEFAACCEALERALPKTKSSGRLRMEHHERPTD
ncbi:hypothetical protein MIND_01228200 [Mycena indigotica]|uniref:Uncharacterized protein n=1 Tax=Mycena indigotica TaxID=2126181 RepID=A0A8H6S344_9AGAR|nr:uncharacterized protein MIND_01228200 [Mycena indigotica]KAF7292024.1 hypothetical protein MIND_01228200 [Mycena indigotica]